MSKNLRRAFVKARPIAQTIAAVVSAIAAIVRILKSLGCSSPLRRRGPPPSGSLLFAARHSKPYTCTSILTYQQHVVKTSPVRLALLLPPVFSSIAVRRSAELGRWRVKL
jgi:hypothetical protein